MDRGLPLIHIVGPGGAGKTTLGSRLAARLNLAFVDLDQQSSPRVGDVLDVMAARGLVEPGESPRTCCQRELRGELGIEMRVGRPA